MNRPSEDGYLVTVGEALAVLAAPDPGPLALGTGLRLGLAGWVTQGRVGGDHAAWHAWQHSRLVAGQKSISSTPSNSPTRTRQGPVRGVAAVGVDPDRRVCRPGVIVHDVEVVGITPSDRQAAPATAGGLGTTAAAGCYGARAPRRRRCGRGQAVWF